MRKKEQQKQGCLGSLVSFFLRSWNWIFSVFCLTSPLSYGFRFCSIPLILAGIASMPIKPIRRLWNRLPRIVGKLKGVLVALIFFVGVMLAPSP